eukprot:scaffold744_cov370-Prasinococcus_capsulatus_cf.AAC.16
MLARAAKTSDRRLIFSRCQASRPSSCMVGCPTTRSSPGRTGALLRSTLARSVHIAGAAVTSLSAHYAGNQHLSFWHYTRTHLRGARLADTLDAGRVCQSCRSVVNIENVTGLTQTHWQRRQEGESITGGRDPLAASILRMNAGPAACLRVPTAGGAHASGKPGEWRRALVVATHRQGPCDCVPVGRPAHSRVVLWSRRNFHRSASALRNTRRRAGRPELLYTMQVPERALRSSLPRPPPRGRPRTRDAAACATRRGLPPPAEATSDRPDAAPRPSRRVASRRAAFEQNCVLPCRLAPVHGDAAAAAAAVVVVVCPCLFVAPSSSRPPSTRRGRRCSVAGRVCGAATRSFFLSRSLALSRSVGRSVVGLVWCGGGPTCDRRDRRARRRRGAPSDKAEAGMGRARRDPAPRGGRVSGTLRFGALAGAKT